MKKLADALCNRVLHTVYMGSENSTTDTRLVSISVFSYLWFGITIYDDFLLRMCVKIVVLNAFACIFVC